MFEIMELSDLNDAKFKTLFIKIFNELMGSEDEFSETSKKDKKQK